jgi:hypothetical protein
MTYIKLMEEKIKLEKELRECTTKGDKILVSRKLDKIKEKIKDLEETTVSGDIAVAPSPMNKKKDILKRPKIEEIEESVSFESLFDIDKNITEFKK